MVNQQWVVDKTKWLILKNLHSRNRLQQDLHDKRHFSTGENNLHWVRLPKRNLHECTNIFVVGRRSGNISGRRHFRKSHSNSTITVPQKVLWIPCRNSTGSRRPNMGKDIDDYQVRFQAFLRNFPTKLKRARKNLTTASLLLHKRLSVTVLWCAPTVVKFALLWLYEHVKLITIF